MVSKFTSFGFKLSTNNSMSAHRYQSLVDFSSISNVCGNEARENRDTDIGRNVSPWLNRCPISLTNYHLSGTWPKQKHSPLSKSKYWKYWGRQSTSTCRSMCAHLSCFLPFPATRSTTSRDSTKTFCNGDNDYNLACTTHTDTTRDTWQHG